MRGARGVARPEATLEEPEAPSTPLCPLLTLDKGLIRAAREAGVEVVEVN